MKRASKMLIETFTFYFPDHSTSSSLSSSLLIFCLSLFPPLSSTVLSLSQRVLQTSKFPQNSGGELLRCQGSSEGTSESATKRKGETVTQPREGKEKIRWKRRKTRKGTAGDTLALLLCGSGSSCPPRRTRSVHVHFYDFTVVCYRRQKESEHINNRGAGISSRSNCSLLSMSL